MKKLFAWLGVILLTFSLGIGSTLLWLKYNRRPTNDLPILSVCELVKNPEKYSGENVRVSAKLYWFQHGYFLADQNCSAGNDSSRIAIIFGEQNRDKIYQKINEAKGSDRLSYKDVIEMIAVGKFEKVGDCGICSDSIVDRTRLHFEIAEIEAAFLAQSNL